MRFGLALLISVQLSACSKEKAESPSVRTIADPVETYYREHLLAEGMTAIGGLPIYLQTIEADFDCDGCLDLAVTDCFEARARVGTWWSIFLRRADGKYGAIGSVGTKSNRFRITPNPQGGGDLAVMLRGGPGDVVVEFYRVTQNGLTQSSVEEVHLAEEDAGTTRIDELFGEGYSELTVTEIPLAGLEKKYPK